MLIFGQEVSQITAGAVVCQTICWSSPVSKDIYFRYMFKIFLISDGIFLMACMWGRFIVGTAHFSTESNLIWSNSIAIKSISPTLGWRKDNMRRFKSLDWKINTSLKNSSNLFLFFHFFPIWLSFVRKCQAPWFNYASPVLLHQLNLILEFRKIKNFPSAKKNKLKIWVEKQMVI